MKPSIVQVGNARREPKAQQVAKREDVVRYAAVGVVDGDIDVATVIKQPVDDVRRFALRHRNHLGVERCVAAGDLGIERDGRTGALVRIDGSEHSACPPSGKC